ncbi:MAG TPA: FAD:protein FMN transferase [Candidatus Saccharimonadales bacterium]|nr:FAD:protein FMN transferase [Candidatus Saccharimonadales bacterium]
MRSHKLSSKPHKSNAPAHVPRLAFEAIGTQWLVDLAVPPAQVPVLANHITARIAEFDKTYSRFRSDSLVTAMSKRAGSFTLPTDAPPLLAFYRSMYRATKGAVTPLIGQTLADAGYDATYRLTPKQLSVPPAWSDVLSYQFPALTLSRPALLDFGAAGKGYVVDLICELLDQHGVDAYCVDAGGDMRRHSNDGGRLRIGLEDPDNPERVIGAIELASQSLCGSAGNRRNWGTYHHIIDPKRLVSPRHIAAVWAMADTAMVADGMTTCLFFAPAHVLRKRFTFDYAILYANGSLECSAAFAGAFFKDHTSRKDVHEAT